MSPKKRLIITDNGDGTWTATGPDNVVTVVDATKNTITTTSIVIIDANTYTITSA